MAFEESHFYIKLVTFWKCALTNWLAHPSQKYVHVSVCQGMIYINVSSSGQLLDLSMIRQVVKMFIFVYLLFIYLDFKVQHQETLEICEWKCWAQILKFSVTYLKMSTYREVTF